MSLHTYSRSNTLSIIVLAVLLLVFSGRPSSAQQSAVLAYVTQHSNEIVADLRSPALSDALMHLVESRGLEVVFAPELLRGEISECRRLPKDDAKAINCVLASSGLKAVEYQPGVYVIQVPLEEPQPTEGRIVGTIRSAESSGILANAHVIIPGTSYSTTSGPDGTFFIDHMDPGTYDLQVSMIGYEPTAFAGIDVKAGQDSELYLNMVETTLLLDEVLITDRKKRGLSLPDSLDPLAYQGFQLGRVRGGLFMSASPAKVDGLQFSGLGSMARDSLKGVQLSGMFNSARSVQGVQFGGIFNTVTGDLNGSQFSGVLNQLGGTLVGGQYAGTFNKAGDVRGVQFAGVANLSDGHVRGVQSAGVVNVSGNFRGAQLAGIANRAFEKTGFQGAGIMNYAVTMRGMQAGGILNTTAQNARGVQAAGLVNFAGGTFRGAQLSGMVNVAGDVVGGVQGGVVNIARTHNGVPVGLLSFVKETGLRLDTWVDERGFVVSAVRSGNRKFSNYLGVGGSSQTGPDSGAILMGFGREFTHNDRLYSTLDALYYFMVEENDDDFDQTIQARFTVGYEILPYLAIFGGPSLNLFLSDNPNTSASLPDRFIDRGQWGNNDYRLWAGFSAGIRLSTNRLY